MNYLIQSKIPSTAPHHTIDIIPSILDNGVMIYKTDNTSGWNYIKPPIVLVNDPDFLAVLIRWNSGMKLSTSYFYYLYDTKYGVDRMKWIDLLYSHQRKVWWAYHISGLYMLHIKRPAKFLLE